MEGKLKYLFGSLAFIIKTSNPNLDVIEIGKMMFRDGADKMVNGGFWIWDVNSYNENKNDWVEYYSPLFRSSLEFENEVDFPNLASSWQNQITDDGLRTSLKNYEKALESKEENPYSQNVVFKTKNDNYLLVDHTGIIVWIENQPSFMIGFNKIISKNGDTNTRKSSSNNWLRSRCFNNLIW